VVPDNYSLLTLCLTALAAFGLSALLTKITLRVLLKKAIMDIPNDRSMHTVPVPRGGGIAVVAVLLCGMVWGLGKSELLWLLPSITILIAVSWLDDRKEVAAGVRLTAHLLAAFLASMVFTPEQSLFGGHLPLWLDRTIMIVGWAWFINLYNFMDGIDGITGMETICVGAGTALAFYVLGFVALLSTPEHSTAHYDTLMSISLTLIGACAGFLVFNWHPAKIFLGDVGSVPLGFLTGYLLLELATDGYWAAALILPLYYLADSGLTLSKRLLRGEKFWKPHRQHFYQRAAQATGKHSIIVLWILAANVALIGISLFSLKNPAICLALATAVVATLLFVMQKKAA
jgi:UDP-N-acetylmuramyl pentapeptide phosphotransferase/UDP-N-acetylglucosamine-1-phosphate transferase